MARSVFQGRLRAGALAGALALTVAAVAVPRALATGGGTSTGIGGGHHHRHHHHHGHRATSSSGPLAGQGMWIWYVSKSSGGTAASIGTQAQAYGIDTVFIKSADAGGTWSQFTPALVSALHARGLQVCGWQFVYGNHPKAEARAGAAAKADGADCLAIDAEGQYEGKYASASVYMHNLRNRVGGSFPLALASFPYVDYHPGLPYSVFLGPGGAQRNAPQVYWHTIGTSPGAALLHTYVYNRVYRRGIVPLGQTFDHPPLAEVRKFSRLSSSYGFRGRSWWSWQETTRSQWKTLGAPTAPYGGFKKTKAYPALHKGNSGDLVVWAQEHLVRAGEKIAVDGGFGKHTQVAVEDFQSRRGIPITGTIGPLTWKALLKVKPVSVNWARPRAALGKAEMPRGGEPRSASDPAVRNEIPSRPPGD